MEPELKTLYNDKVRESLLKELNLKNVHQVPRLDKIVINCSIGSQAERKQAIEDATNEVTLITGQKPMTTFSKKAIASFKLRAGEPVGVKVTLRGNRMYDFLMRLVKTAMPRIRDFRGVNEKSFDGKGNYTMGVTEQIIFPEIQIDKVNKIMGMDITFVTSSPTDAEAFALLKQFGLPFKNQKN